MTQAGLIARLVQAAETWGYRRYQQEVVVVEQSQPECCPDGRMKTEIELEPVKGGQGGRRLRCIATLELDGTVSCIEAGATFDTSWRDSERL
jgi:hypothetical protein